MRSSNSNVLAARQAPGEIGAYSSSKVLYTVYTIVCNILKQPIAHRISTRRSNWLSRIVSIQFIAIMHEKPQTEEDFRVVGYP